MTAPVLSLGDQPLPTVEPLVAPTAFRPLYSTAKMMAGAGALLGLIEILLDRVGAALVAYLAPSLPGLARILERGGSAVAGAVAALVILSAVLLGASLRRGSGVDRIVLLIAAVLTVIASVSWVTAPLHLTVIVGATVIVLFSEPRGLMRAAVAAVGITVVLGQISFLMPALGDSSLVRSGAEAGLLAAPALAAFHMAASRPTRLVWASGAAAATAASALIVARPGFSALLATWALGATLALPVALYVIAASGSGMLAAGALTDPRARSVAAGIALLWVAGAAPNAVHHNLSALLGVFLLAHGSSALVEGSDDEAVAQWQI